jgi:hypothetical protein
MDLALGRVHEATHATTNSEAFRRSVSIADFFVSERAKGHRIFVQSAPDEPLKEIEIV